MSFPFDENPKVAVMTCIHVIKENKPILYVSHDSDDGMWQFLCGGTHQTEDAMIVGLYEIYERDNSLVALAELPLGCSAERKYVGANWTARKM